MTDSSLARALWTLSPLTLVTIGASLLQVKLLAVLLGPNGMGFFFLVISFLNLFTLVASLGVSSSVTKLVAEFTGSSRWPDIWRTTVLGLLTVTAVTTIMILLVLSDQGLFWRFLLGGRTVSSDQRRFILVLCFLAALPTTWNLCMQAVLKGLRSIRHYMWAGVLSTLVIMLTILVPAVFYGAYGALLGSIVGQFISFAIFTYFSLKVARAKRIPLLLGLRSGDSLRLLRRLSWLGATALGALLAGALGHNVVRSFLATDLSLAAVAYFGASWSLTNRLPVLIYQTFGAYIAPRISALGSDWRAIVKEQNRALELGLLLGTPALCAMIALQNWLIPVLFTSKFLPMAPILRVMLVGELLSIVFWVVSLALYPTGRAVLNAAAEWAWWIVFVSGLVVFSRRWGLQTVGWAYVSAYGLLACAVYAWERIHHGLRWSNENRRLLMVSVGTVGAVAGMGSLSGWSDLTQLGATAALIIGWAVVALAPQRYAIPRTAVRLLHLRAGERRAGV